jgi:hypothetical protein
MHSDINEKWTSKKAAEKYIEGEIISFTSFSLLVVFELAKGEEVYLKQIILIIWLIIIVEQGENGKYFHCSQWYPLVVA